MGDDRSLELAKAIAELLPVKVLYDDALKKPAAVVGDISTDILKTLHLPLAPIAYAAALRDRIVNFVDRAVRNVPAERRTAPAPQVLGKRGDTLHNWRLHRAAPTPIPTVMPCDDAG